LLTALIGSRSRLVGIWRRDTGGRRSDAVHADMVSLLIVCRRRLAAS
jgi:hypothetical protein